MSEFYEKEAKQIYSEVVALGGGLVTATDRLHAQTNEYAKAKETYETAVSGAYSAGLVQGKNQTERDAWVRQSLENEYAAMNNAEMLYNLARQKVSLLQTNLDILKLRLRTLELINSQ